MTYFMSDREALLAWLSDSEPNKGNNYLDSTTRREQNGRVA
jgi:hypothetical protein